MEQPQIATTRALRASTDSHEATAAHVEERVSILVGDRLCHKCGYNLTGQNVLREPHYRMLIVRCPECATVASVQEYPLLGRWANRWAMLLAGLAMMAMIALWLGSGGAIFGMSLAVAEITADKYRNVIDTLYYTSAQQAAAINAVTAPGLPGAVVAPMPIQVPGRAPVVIQTVAASRTGGFNAWWMAQDQDAILASAGGWRDVVEWRALWIWVPLGFAAFAIGCLWAVILMARRGWGAVLCGPVIMIMAVFFSFFPMYEWLFDTAWSPSAAASAMISPPFLVASLVFAMIPLCLGLLLGRSVARGLVRLMLPPRLCGALATLWTVDGLKPPRITVKPR